MTKHPQIKYYLIQKSTEQAFTKPSVQFFHKQYASAIHNEHPERAAHSEPDMKNIDRPPKFCKIRTEVRGQYAAGFFIV